MKLHELPASVTRRKRVGRGTATGTGKTAGRGTKGQKSRAGHHYMPVHFEGGQMPLTQRIPKLRGFRNPVAYRWATVTVAQLANAKLAKADLGSLKVAGLVPRSARYLKVIGTGAVPTRLTLQTDRVSAGARQAIEGAGGSITLPTPSVHPTKAEKPAVSKPTNPTPTEPPTEETDA